MSEVPLLLAFTGGSGYTEAGLQGYLPHNKSHPLGALQKDYACGPTAVLGGVRFIMSEVPLYGRPRLWRCALTNAPGGGRHV